jgi:hypothetical protein
MRMSLEHVWETSPRMWNRLNRMADTALGRPGAGGRVSSGAVAGRKGGREGAVCRREGAGAGGDGKEASRAWGVDGGCVGSGCK